MTTLFSRGFPQRNAKHPLQDVIPGIISAPGACRSSHIHGGPIEVWQGWVDDAVVRIGGCPLEAEDVWLTEQLQQDAVLQAAPAAHDKPQSMDAEDEKVSDTFTACSLRVSQVIPASFCQSHRLIQTHCHAEHAGIRDALECCCVTDCRPQVCPIAQEDAGGGCNGVVDAVICW